MIAITKAEYISEYKIHVWFNDDKEGIINLEETLLNDHRLLFRELADKNKFKKFRVAFDTLVWENGLDLAPEFLYSMLP